jgi:hypothetical protein
LPRPACLLTPRLQHLNSKVHRGSRVPCLFCSASYTTASGLVHHIEMGSCPRAPNLNHATVLRMIRERDTHGLITNPAIGWDSEQGEEETGTRYEATSLAFNGAHWECYLCHRGFVSAAALTGHLNSPAHAAQAYRCPNRPRCRREFTTLAGFFGHLESESCRFMRFERVQHQVGDVLRGNMLLTAGY